MNGGPASISLRALVVALLLLAVSPVTAPFSTYDLQDLFGGTSHGVAVFQSKTGPDESTVHVSGAPDLRVTRHATPDAPRPLARSDRGARPLHVPLRL